ncbi:MAG: HEAT repeat domain-containing protein [Acidobacteriota bacterium]
MKPRHATLGLAILFASRLTLAAPSEFDAAVEKLQKGTVPKERAQAVTALGKLKDPRAIPYLVEALGLHDADPEKDWFVRGQASNALATFGKAALEALKKAAEDKEPVIRKGALNALGKIRGPEANETLKKHLETDADASVRTTCIFNFRDMKLKEAIPWLRGVAKSDKDPEVREKAGRIADKIEKGS